MQQYPPLSPTVPTIWTKGETPEDQANISVPTQRGTVNPTNGSPNQGPYFQAMLKKFSDSNLPEKQRSIYGRFLVEYFIAKCKEIVELKAEIAEIKAELDRDDELDDEDDDDDDDDEDCSDSDSEDREDDESFYQRRRGSDVGMKD
ncbi:hypothetical protein K470DRAFT_263776 [Piedraia hortae CBS 480.64]|uniref:Uncharacterized protein n=1 Tax=Piedraia hortae CBS 480.64 TaxID=1314780 RepID=A0A6A7C1K0_9PEZI|nr:hypothetical protein K470DRAFT_263776 [Piedraia hortae CBS 480.64]